MTVKIGCTKKNRVREFELETIVGEVVDIQQNIRTNISSTRGYMNANTGTYISPQVHSSNTQVDTVFIRNAEGREITLKLQNSSIPLRVGNKVSVPCIVEKQEKDSLEFITGIVNHDTKEGARLYNGRVILKAFNVGPKDAVAITIWGASTIIGAALTADYYYTGAIAGLLIGMLLSNPGNNLTEGAKEIESLIDQHIASLLNDGPKMAQAA